MMTMRILALADVESRYLWDFFEKSKLEGIDLIISAGDLAPQYLSFLATYAKCPLLYVHGNHDSCYDDTPPEGCDSLEDTVIVYKGLRIVGLGGSMLYNYGEYQYSEKDMHKRVKKLRKKLKKTGGFDILVAHSPARGINDCEDRPHMGFECFRDLLDEYSPKAFIHGHVHKNYGRDFKREDKYKDTTIYNAYERLIIEI